MHRIFLTVFCLSFLAFVGTSQNNHEGHNHGAEGHETHEGHDHGSHEGHDHGSHEGHNHGSHQGHNHGSHGASSGCGGGHGHDHGGEEEFDASGTAFHHIADANVYSIGPVTIPLPCMLYSPEGGFDMFLSNKFKHDFIGHGDGQMAYKGYVLDGGSVKRVQDNSFPRENVGVNGFVHKHEEIDGKDRLVSYVCYKDNLYKLDSKSTADYGLFGGGITSYYDFSLTKNVTSMLLIFGFLSWLFLSIARQYKERVGMAPTGKQSLIETIFVFIQDEVAKPFLGDKYMKYLPFLMALFFFILGLNLWGQIPFFGGANVTGNLAVTMVLAIFAFFVVNLSGTKDYWKHIFWMPGVPAWVKTILTPVEVLGVFIKPLTLMLRLFANITAGHIVIISFIGLIFIFGKMGASVGGSALGLGVSLPLTFFMMAIELLVAFIQAFVFTILTASYIGAAIEEHDHH